MNNNNKQEENSRNFSQSLTKGFCKTSLTKKVFEEALIFFHTISACSYLNSNAKL